MDNKYLSIYSGVAFTFVIGLTGNLLAGFIPIGGVAIAIIIGIIAGNLIKIPASIEPGVTFSEKHILSVAIALMGVKLNFTILESIGLKGAVLVVSAMVVTIVSAVLLGRFFKLNKNFALLLGVGNAVCGSSAIAAANGVVKADEESVGLSVAIVNFLGTIGIFLIPVFVTQIVKFSEINSGIVAGNTLQAVGQVVAAGATIDGLVNSDTASQIAMIIKMSRILMLFPLIFILIAVKKDNKKDISTIKGSPVPPFIIGFVLLTLIPTFNLLPAGVISQINFVSHFALLTAMAGIGLKIRVGTIINDGVAALSVGAVVWVIQIAFTTAAVYFFSNT